MACTTPRPSKTSRQTAGVDSAWGGGGRGAGGGGGRGQAFVDEVFGKMRLLQVGTAARRRPGGAESSRRFRCDWLVEALEGERQTGWVGGGWVAVRRVDDADKEARMRDASGEKGGTRVSAGPGWEGSPPTPQSRPDGE